MSCAPAWPPSPEKRTRSAAGAAMAITMPSDVPLASSSGPCSMCSCAGCPHEAASPCSHHFCLGNVLCQQEGLGVRIIICTSVLQGSRAVLHSPRYA